MTDLLPKKGQKLSLSSISGTKVCGCTIFLLDMVGVSREDIILHSTKIHIGI